MNSLLDSVAAYESHADDFLRARDNSRIGITIVDQWAREFERGADVLELGSGGGYPVTQVLNSIGLNLFAVESSATLVSRFKTRFPDIVVECSKVQDSDFFNQNFDGIIAIGLIFLLPEEDQKTTINAMADILKPNGRFLFTAPIETGNWVDQNTGIPCNSLGRAVYEDCFQNAGFKLIDTHEDSGKNNYYDLQKIC